jgi:hypothetical protein
MTCGRATVCGERRMTEPFDEVAVSAWIFGPTLIDDTAGEDPAVKPIQAFAVSRHHETRKSVAAIRL